MKIRTTKQFLTKVDEFFSGPKTWTQGAFARTARKRIVSVDDKRATACCLSGAVRVIANRNKVSSKMRDNAFDAISAAIKVYTKTRPKLRGLHGSIGNVPYFNDLSSTKFEDIKAVVALARDSFKR